MSPPENDNYLYDCTFAVLGTQSDSEEFSALLGFVGTPSKIYKAYGADQRYEFPSFGLQLGYATDSSRFWLAAFEFNSHSVRTGAAKPFPGNPPFGVCWEDSSAQAQQKIGVMPDRTRIAESALGTIVENWHYYFMLPYQYLLVFDAAKDALAVVTVSLFPDLEHIGMKIRKNFIKVGPDYLSPPL